MMGFASLNPSYGLRSAQRPAEPARVEAVEVARHRDDLAAGFLGHPRRELVGESRLVLGGGERLAGAALGGRHELRKRAAVAQRHAHAGGGGELVARSLDLV